MQILKKEEDCSQDDNMQDSTLMKLKDWMQYVEPIKIVKLSEDLMMKMLDNWSKFRISLLRKLNEQENRVLDSMNALRKQVQWLNQVKLGKNPEISKTATKLLKECMEFEQKKIGFELKSMLKQTQLICDKTLYSIKVTFEGIKQKITELVQQFKQVSTFRQILTRKTYFRFLQNRHHSDISLLSNTHISVDNQSHEMDFGAVIGPALTATNYRICVRIDRNDKYQCFIGVGVCHPDIVKSQYYKGTGIGSGCYVIRQESDTRHSLALSHAYQKEGTHKRLKSVPWGFGEGDTILIQMDFEKKTVGFSKGEEYYEMRVDVDQGSINPYVVLHSRWDSIAIQN